MVDLPSLIAPDKGLKPLAPRILQRAIGLPLPWQEAIAQGPIND